MPKPKPRGYRFCASRRPLRLGGWARQMPRGRARPNHRTRTPFDARTARLSVKACDLCQCRIDDADARVAGAEERFSPLPRSPAVAQLAQFQEDGLRVRVFGQVGEGLAQARDDDGAAQAEERVDLLFEAEGRDQRPRRVLALRLRQQLAGLPVVGLAVEG